MANDSRSSRDGIYGTQQVSTVFRPVAVRPTHLDTILRYNQLLIQQPGTLGVVGCYQFRLNSIFDPDLTGTGHQPYYRDQLVAMGYEYYAVYACTVTLRASVNAVSPNATLLLGIRANSDSSSDAGSDMSALEEKNLTSMAVVTLAKPVNMQRKFFIADIAGLPREASLQQYNLIAGYGANPVQPICLNINVQDADHATTTSALNVEVRLDYHVRMFYTYPIAQS